MTDNGINDTLQRLVEKIGRLDERSKSHHANHVERMVALEAGQAVIVAHQQEHGAAIARLQAVCESRPRHCSARAASSESRTTRLSDEVDALREATIRTHAVAEANRDELRANGAQLKEVSKVVHIADIERRAQSAAWARVGKTVWHYGWRGVLILAGLGALGGAAAGLVKLVK